MQYDLNKMNRKDLQKLRSDTDKAIASLADREKKAALDAAEKAAAEHGYTLSELAGTTGKKPKATKTKSPAKYRNPENADQTWTGRGRRPAWINEAEAAGNELSDYEIR